MIIRDGIAVAAFVVALAVVEGTAFAAPPEMTKLFEQGRALVKEGHYEAAVPRFLEAIAIEPSVGALLNLGDCYERLGKPASARRRFLEAAELAGEVDVTRSSEARARAAKLDSVVARVVFVRRATADAEARGAEPRIVVDGEALPPRVDRVEVDPGVHEVIVTFPGAPADKRDVLVRTAQSLEVVIEPPARKAGAGDAGTKSPGTRSAGTKSANATIAADDGLGWSTRQWTALGVGGVGVVALAVGATSGVIALGKQSDLDASCPGYPRCPEAQRSSVAETYDDASRYAAIATVGVLAGVALVATGVVLWLTAPEQKKRTTTGSMRWSLAF